MYYRTKTYLAGDWTGDIDAITTLKKWNNDNYLTTIHNLSIEKIVYKT